ncbi:MAG: DUF4160 domain-containing protein [Rhodospirillales bacterium]|nr:DUF4160 domain-containing protein [Rhodospirillales bacterium]
MPVIFRWNGIRFFFYSNEGNPREPMHIHAEGLGSRLINPTRRALEENGRMTGKTR